MEKITPQPQEREAKTALEWLAGDENNGLNLRGLTDIVTLLISKVNELSGEVDYLKNRVNQHDSFI